MARKKTPVSPTKADMDRTIASFERAFVTIDAAVGAALIAGAHPYAFEPVLSYWFMHTLATGRGVPKAQFAEWMKNPSNSFDLILNHVNEFTKSFRGELMDAGEEEELHGLVQQSLKGDYRKLPQLDQQRHSKTAVAVVEWVFTLLERDENLPVILVELAFLCEYLKVCAIAGDVSPEVYLVVRQSAPEVLTAYRDLPG
jgi:hypothetical protein